MRGMRQSIIEDRFPAFIEDFFLKQFPEKNYPEWAVDALKAINVILQ